MNQADSETVHATAVARDGRAVLLFGRSGAGKSDLALRLIDRGWVLVSDDYTAVRRERGVAVAEPPVTIAGRIEVRGVGIMEMPHVASVPVALICDLDAVVERMPDSAERAVAGVALPYIALAAFEASAPIKLELALARISS
ncbi:HPr kinase/phosphorylase [Sphingomonas prati]|uniref:Serine kinase of HPr protein (Carbohydrate metabolism regulator) n=1 Tax=Sphingomonas prati TaxID=1843237 RepID=A0A7W9F2K3_9SPHN|nr:aldolase [Sphingomonas prati]MBB5728585.1 serine kinase of HPr protein (carbohydrate metabolism regulator) [Sphingomonas prati]GGE72641.1 HPr kinase [Sphingomonas prati]